MSQRERWIIYPLLFFCFSMCIKLYWYPEYRSVHARVVTCEQLNVSDVDGRPLVTIRGDAGDGQVLVHAAPASRAVGRAPLHAVRLGVSQNRRGMITAFSEIGQPLVELQGSPSGGNVVLFNAAGEPKLVRVARLKPEPTTPAAIDDPRTAPVRPPVPPAP